MSNLCINTTAIDHGRPCGRAEDNFVHVYRAHEVCPDKRYCVYHPFEPGDTVTQQDRVIREFDTVANMVSDLGRSIGFEGINKNAGMASVDAIIADLRRAIVRAS